MLYQIGFCEAGGQDSAAGFLCVLNPFLVIRGCQNAFIWCGRLPPQRCSIRRGMSYYRHEALISSSSLSWHLLVFVLKVNVLEAGKWESVWI